MKEITVTWQSVAYPHSWVGDIGKMQALSQALGYKMFCWNDRIYNTTDCTYTGITSIEVQ